MGGLFSGFQRERPTEALQRLAYDIQRVHINIVTDKQRRRRAMTSSAAACLIICLAIFFGLHLIAAINWMVSLLCTGPMIVVSIIIHAAIKFYFTWSLKKNMIKLTSLKDEKRKILELVKNTESYAVAKAVLDKFDTADDVTDGRTNLV